MENACPAKTTATVFNIQKFCTDDGPGIRTTVFLKGCHLRCAWCHNPEGLSKEPLLEYSDINCAFCKACAAVCPNQVHRFEDGQHRIDRDRCTQCGACISACSFGALAFCGKTMTADEVMAIALADKAFYFPDGGITVSGGEPLLQPDFVLALGRLAKAHGIHFCVETSGAVPFAVIEPLLPVVDLFLFDIKETDSENHKRFIGMENRLPLENIRKLDDCGKPIVMRCPIIPTVNDRPSHFEALAKLYVSLKHAQGIQLMPYHSLGQGKNTRYGAASQDFTVPSAEEKAAWNQMIQSAIAKEKAK